MGGQCMCCKDKDPDTTVIDIFSEESNQSVVLALVEKSKSKIDPEIL